MSDMAGYAARERSSTAGAVEIQWSERDERHGRLRRKGERSTTAGAVEIQWSARARDIEGKVTRLGASKPGDERVSIQERAQDE